MGLFSFAGLMLTEIYEMYGFEFGSWTTLQRGPENLVLNLCPQLISPESNTCLHSIHDQHSVIYASEQAHIHPQKEVEDSKERQEKRHGDTCLILSALTSAWYSAFVTDK